VNAALCKLQEGGGTIKDVKLSTYIPPNNSMAAGTAVLYLIVYEAEQPIS
jgi:hypothetical protein